MTNDYTRRQWLLRLGETVVLVGVSGAAEAGVQTAPETALAPGATALPPGLYLPSNDHLAHALASNARFHPVVPGSETDYVRPRSGPFQPQFFSTGNYQMIHRLVALLLGEPAQGVVSQSSADDTIVDEVAQWLDLSAHESAAARKAARALSAQHRALAVAYYGAEEVAEAENTDPQKVARDGLQWLAAEAAGQGSAFDQLDAVRQQALLQTMSTAAEDSAGGRFFRWLKAETIRGFYTSRVGLKELDYKGNYFYTESPGCPSVNATRP